VLRYGFFYGSSTWYAPDGIITEQVRQHQFPILEKLPILEKGEGVWPWVHVEDSPARSQLLPPSSRGILEFI